ncbi:MAG: hypothetical protein H6765_07115 [Candidatus Peribacteria bacterium]|nr:MAG: hypothetical protein H6765_07115 [Candidatus Peribacteria bacterium]
MHDKRKFDLAMLIGYALHKSRDAQLTLCMTCDDYHAAEHFLQDLIKEARFPLNTRIYISTADTFTALKESPESDLHIIAITSDEIDTMRLLAKSGRSCLFVTDAGSEDILS